MMAGRIIQPRTPLMVDASLVEIRRHVEAAIQTADSLPSDDAQNVALKAALRALLPPIVKHIEKHRETHSLGTPNH